MAITKKQSDTLFVLKCLAAIMIVSAHCCSVPADFSQPTQYISSAMQLFSRGGVGIFFLISGYLFSFHKYSFSSFWKRKLTTLIVPWLFTGTLVYLYVALRKQSVGVADWFFWIAGVKTYLWYMTVLAVLYILFLLFARYKAFLIIVPILSIASYATYSLTYPYLWQWGGNYLNVFSWSLIFWGGYMVGKRQWLDAIISFASKYRVIWLFLYVAFILIFVGLDIPCNYGMMQYILYVVLCVLATLSLSVLLCKYKLVKSIGTDSFAIYLLHMPVAGIVANLCNRVDSVALLLVRPIIVVAVLEIALSILRYFTKRYPRLAFINALIGTR